MRQDRSLDCRLHVSNSPSHSVTNVVDGIKSHNIIAGGDHEVQNKPLPFSQRMTQRLVSTSQKKVVYAAQPYHR